MATLTINTWELIPLNPDQTDNSFLPSLSGTVPTNESVDWAAMGQMMKLVLNCEMTGTYSDSSTANVLGTLIRYNPGMFVDAFSQFVPVGSFPNGGYSFTVTSTSPNTYQMPMSGQFENLNNAENGSVTLEVLTSTTFTITHIFRMTSDIESYLIGRKQENKYRLSKSSQLAVNERSIDHPSVYGWDKALNALVATQQRRFNLISYELSIAFAASFDNYDSSGIVSIPAEFKIERVSDLGTFVDEITPFEDNRITVIFEDPSSEVTIDECEVILTYRGLIQNVATFERDLQIQHAKLIADAGTTQITGALYNPVVYTVSGGETKISFIVKGTDLQKAKDYQIHVIAGLPDGPSQNKMLHVMSGLLRTDGAPQDVTFTMSAETWTRNGNHAQDFTITEGERATSVLSMNKTEYDANAANPFTTFDDDIDTLFVRIFDETDTLIFVKSIQKNVDGSWTNTAFIGIEQTDGPSEDAMFYAYLKEFRVPYLNYQNLPDWSGNTYKIQWSARFLDQTDPTFGLVCLFDSQLTVRGYENTEPSPSQDVVTNIKFLDPVTGLPITNWCDLTEIMVTANIENVGADTYVLAMVDRFPLGVEMFNDFALQEEDIQSNSLPDYVIFAEKASELISELTDVADGDGIISFILDVSTLAGEDKFRIYVQAYRVVS